ncbi:MAG: DPP IV N-terminal domain-containing protein [Myxococcota bacterium]
MSAGSEFLHQFAATYRFRLGRPSAFTWAGDTKIYFLRSGPRSFVRDLYLFDLESGQESVALSSERLLAGKGEELSPEEIARRERLRLADRGITSFSFSPDARTILVPLSGQLFLADTLSGNVSGLSSRGGPAIDARFSPSGREVFAVRDGDLWSVEVATGLERQWTSRASEDISYGLAEFVAEEEMARHRGYWIAPDGNQVLVQRTDVSGLERMHISDPMAPHKEPRAFAYPRAGKANAEVRLLLVDLNGGPSVPVEWDHDRYPYLSGVRWDGGAPLTLILQNRAQTEIALFTVDKQSGALSPLFTEQDPTWLNLDQDMPRWLPDGSGLLWTSERDGEWRVELRDPSGALIRPLTPLGFGYSSLVSLDGRRRTLYLRASVDPSQGHVYRLPIDSGGAPEPLTDEPGQHALVFSRSHELYVQSLHTLDGRLETRVVAAKDRALKGRLQHTAEAPPFVPKLELARVGQAPGLDTLLIRPRDFSSQKRYPVIVSVYGGPHAKMVSATPHDYVLQQWMADQGFVVISIDGRGTPGRGRAFERAIHGDFAHVALEDQVRALEALFAAHPELDRTRVGIYGWSFGGYLSAIAALLRPDVFSAAVAGAPVTDWLDYDTHYTERYLGHPDTAPEAYTKSSCLTYAADLSRPLLLIHGTSDDNVYFSHSMKLSDALFRAGKAHDFLPLSGFTHMVPDPLVTERLYGRIIGWLKDKLGAPR